MLNSIVDCEGMIETGRVARGFINAPLRPSKGSGHAACSVEDRQLDRANTILGFLGSG